MTARREAIVRNSLLPELKLGPTTVMILVGVLGAALVAGCAAAPRQRPVKMGDVDTGANSLEAARRQLEGTWDLTSLKTYSSPGTAPTKAEGITAVLSYDAYGNLRIMGNPGSAGTLPGGASGLLTYSGRAVIDPVKKELRLLDIEGGTDPNVTLDKELAVGRVRRYTIENGVLTISVLDAAGQPSATTTWKKRS
jgi:hypothetical protein